MIALKKVPTSIRPCVSVQAGVGVGGLGAGVEVAVGVGEGVALGVPVGLAVGSDWRVAVADGADV